MRSIEPEIGNLTRMSIRRGFEARIARFQVAGGRYAVIDSWRDVSDYLPAPGENTLMVTRKQFSAFELVPILLHSQCERILITTFNISLSALGMLHELLAGGQIAMADLLVSESIQRLSGGENVLPAIRSLTKAFPGTVRVRLIDIHVKLIAMAMSDGAAWVVEGSGNMARNANIELYSLFNDPGRFMFHAGWIGELL